jgi:transcriptional regulator with XRE-family HTH domain
MQPSAVDPRSRPAHAGEVFTPQLQLRRRWLALSQEELARLAGVGRTTVARAERGLSIRPSSVRKLARALGISPRELQQPLPPDIDPQFD